MLTITDQIFRVLFFVDPLSLVLIMPGRKKGEDPSFLILHATAVESTGNSLVSSFLLAGRFLLRGMKGMTVLSPGQVFKRKRLTERS